MTNNSDRQERLRHNRENALSSSRSAKDIHRARVMAEAKRKAALAKKERAKKVAQRKKENLAKRNA